MTGDCFELLRRTCADEKHLMRLQSVNALFKFRWRGVEISGTKYHDKYITLVLIILGLNVSKTQIFLTLLAHYFAMHVTFRQEHATNKKERG